MILSTHDFRRRAKQRLPRMVFDYLEGGAEDESALSRNCTAFEAMQFLPRRLVDVAKRSSKTKLWGKQFDLPAFIAPTGLNGLFRPRGDAMLARAAAKANIPFALSTASNMSIEEIAKEGDGEKWFQLYVLYREIANIMCDRALKAGYEALILTVDVAVNGYRERELRNHFALPVKYRPKTLLDGALHPRWALDFMRHGVPELRNFDTLENVSPEMRAALIRRQMDASFDFDALKKLRDRWPKKLIVKGILRVDDAKKCAKASVDAIIVSNHGGRQIDGAIPALDALEQIAAAVDIPVLFDSGVRRGSDIVKACCLGAKMAGLGRAVLYALGADGEAGVERCIEILKDEIDRHQALLGAPEIKDLTADLLKKE